MKHESIDLVEAVALVTDRGALPVDASSAGLQAALAHVASGIDSRFVAAGEALARAYAVVERLIASLEGVSQALDGEAVSAAVTDMQTIAGRLTCLPTMQQTRGAALITIGGTGKAVQTPLARFDRTLRFLRICGLNIKVAAAGADGFDGFADLMISRLDVAETEMRSFAEQIDSLERGVAAALEAEQRLVLESARVIPEVPLRLSRDASSLQAEQAKSREVASRIAAAARDIRSQIGIAIGALQIGDITRQRLEHIVSGFAELHALGARDANDPVAAHALALLAAQAADTTEDFRREAGLLANTLRDLGPRATALIALTGDGPLTPEEGGSGFSPLEMLGQSIDEVCSLAGRLQEADAISDRIGSTTLVTAEALATRLTVIKRVTLDVRQMAWNTDLRSRRLGDAGRGLGAVATEIRNFSLELESFSRDIAAVSGQIANSAQAMRGAEGGLRIDVSHALDDALRCVREGGRAVREGMNGLDSEAAELSDFLRQTMGDVDCEVEFGTALAEASRQMSSLAGTIETLDDAAPELADLLARIAARYTMAREREVHRGFAPPLSGDEADTATIADDSNADDDDDGLF
ncbi:chemotaxis protein [soil metagenome]